ncbi:hypothetical protein M7784_09880 [Desulfovibrio aminophilus]|nr:hypothetical protein [Desulfovibrio aminophilus]MCM0755552.1 hypothetical protein [Desulfovibrio aminophilus]
MDIIILLLAGVALLFVLDVIVGDAFFGRLPLRDFLFGGAPFFLLIPGLGLLSRHPLTALAVFALAVTLFLAGRFRRRHD